MKRENGDSVYSVFEAQQRRKRRSSTSFKASHTRRADVREAHFLGTASRHVSSPSAENKWRSFCFIMCKSFFCAILNNTIYDNIYAWTRSAQIVFIRWRMEKTCHTPFAGAACAIVHYVRTRLLHGNHGNFSTIGLLRIRLLRKLWKFISCIKVEYKGNFKIIETIIEFSKDRALGRLWGLFVCLFVCVCVLWRL